MTDVIPAPHHDVVSYLDERLDRVVFKDEAVVAAPETRPSGRFRAHVANELTASLFGLVALLRTMMVHLLEAHRDEHVEIAGRIDVLDFFESDHPQSLELFHPHVVCIDRERDDPLVRGIVQKIEVCELGPVAGPNYHNTGHHV